MGPAEAREVMELYGSWSTVSIEPALLITASRLHERHRISWWDALIVEAARVAGAHRILTEDLQHGQVIEGVLIEDPFRSRTRS